MPLDGLCYLKDFDSLREALGYADAVGCNCDMTAVAQYRIEGKPE